MLSYYFNIALIYFIIGFASALISFFLLKRKVLGKFWGALLVGCVGAFFGGLFEFLFSDIIKALSNLNDAVNIFPPLITAFLLLWLFSRLSGNNKE